MVGLATEGFEGWGKETSRVGLGLALKVPKTGKKRAWVSCLGTLNHVDAEIEV